MDWKTLATLAYYADAAYSKDSILQNRPVNDLSSLVSPLFPYSEGGALPDWIYPQLSGSAITGEGFYVAGSLEAMVAFNASAHQVVLSIRGTDSLIDWLSYSGVATAIDALVLPFQPLLDAVHAFAIQNGASVLITGHSLGGVIAEAIATNESSWIAGGAFFASPGSPKLAFSDLNPGQFLHVARAQDFVGQLFADLHAADTFTIDDFRFDLIPFPGLPSDFSAAHSSLRYAVQMATLSQSPLAQFIDPSVGGIAFLDDRAPTQIDLGAPGGTHDAYHGFDNILFGSPYGDTITYSGSTSSIYVDGGGGSDSLSGGPLADILAGGAGNDNLAGEGGDDRLFGGSGADRYSIGIYEGFDTISDLGSDGVDIVAVSTGSLFDHIDYGWFSRNGDDLLVRAYAPDGSLAINMRIVGMAASAGRIEHFDLYAGDGYNLAQSWDLGALWAGLAQPEAPPAPAIVVPSESSVFTSGNDNIIRGGGDDILITRGQGLDTIDFGDGVDTLVIDYSWTSARVMTGTYPGYGYSATGYGESHAYNVERVVLIGGSGNDTLMGLEGLDVLIGGAGNDFIEGYYGDDVVFGGDGDDIIGGGWGTFGFDLGTDWVDGGAGDDTWMGGVIVDSPVRFVADLASSAEGFTLADGTHLRNIEHFQIITGDCDDEFWVRAGDGVSSGLGNDRISYSGLSVERFSYVDGGGGEDRLVIDASDASTPVAMNWGQWELNIILGGTVALRATGVEAVEISGGSGDDYLYGQSGDDRLDGDAGDDYLSGGAGIDWYDGGSGEDFADLDLSDETHAVRFSGAAAASTDGYTLIDGTHLRDVERVSLLTGTGDDQISLSSWGRQYVSSGGGDDELRYIGGAGQSSWSGGAGDDHLLADLSTETANLSLSWGGPTWGTLGWGAWSWPSYANQLSFDGVERFTVIGGSGNDNLTGRDGDDDFSGNGGNDYLYGEGGDDRLDGGTGDDYLSGGAGVNWYDGGSGHDAADVNLASETRDVSFSIVAASSAAGQTLVDGTYLRNVERVYLTTGSGDDESLFTALESGGYWEAGLGDDRLTVDLSAITGDVSAGFGYGVSGSVNWGYASGAWQNSVSFNAVENLTVLGGSGNDQMYGRDGDDDFSGNGGNDYLYGDGGNDRLDGGAGDDALYGGTGVNWYDGGSGYDAADVNLTDETRPVSFSIVAASSAAGQTLVDGTYLRNVERIYLTTGSGDDSCLLTGFSSGSYWEAGSGDDRLTVDLSATTDVVSAGYGYGYSGTVNWGYVSGAWQNSVSFNAVENLTILAGSGNDQLNGSDGDDYFSGNGGNDYLYGAGGNDRLDGGAGDDTLIGGTGDDIFVVGSANDIVVENEGGGTDTIETSLTYSLMVSGAYVENLTLTGTGAISGTGNGLANVIAGNSAANTLYGLGGDDRLDGGGGADQMIGGLGNDIYIVSDAGDLAVEWDGEGTDTVLSSITYSLPGQFVENLILTGGNAINGTGNKLNNLLTGNGAANTLNGGDGNDTIDGGGGIDLMIGGLGDDIFYVRDIGDLASESANGGNDLVYASVSYSLAGQYIENLTLIGAAAINGTGNSLANVLTGNSAANVLDGGDGNDRIDGGVGADTMIGGAGDDIFYVSDVGDVAVELGSSGSDTVYASISYSLAGQYIETLVLTGNGAINAMGNSLANTLTGNAAANTLDGGSGIDTMTGGLGDDIYYVGEVGDLAVEREGEGTDSVISSITFSLAGQFIENLTLAGGSAINGTGNKLDNVLTGNSAANTLTGAEGNDRLDGGAGADTLIGGVGDDTYIVDNTGDLVVETSSSGYDSVFASVSYSLAGQYIEDLTLSGNGAINGTGNSLANILTGNSASNVLSAADGNDALHGGLGTDTLTGGNGLDSFWFDTVLGSVDTITDFNVAADAIYLDGSIFSVLNNGVLAAAAFVNGGVSLDADDRILYDSATGNIYYDADGVGGAAAIQFAKVAAGTALTRNDFVVEGGLNPVMAVVSSFVTYNLGDLSAPADKSGGVQDQMALVRIIPGGDAVLPDDHGSAVVDAVTAETVTRADMIHVRVPQSAARSVTDLFDDSDLGTPADTIILDGSAVAFTGDASLLAIDAAEHTQLLTSDWAQAHVL